MIQSMTGFGKAIIPIKEKSINIEIKSLNSKQADTFIRIPTAYREIEMEIRNYLKSELKRGKIECIIDTENNTVHKTEINTTLATEYFEKLQQLATSLNLDIPNTDIFNTVVNSPQILTTSKDSIDEEELKELWNAIASVVTKLKNFRIQEGKSLHEDLLSNVKHIENLLSQVIPYEKERIEKIKERLKDNLENISVSFDNERFEQELLYYIEKLDINEEKIRLTNHCKYFKETLDSKEDILGKKLGFISQEMGREINTLGSKANHAIIQNIVVQMKEALEKIKEQVLNVL